MIDRKKASELLNVSVHTLIRMEKRGVLKPIKYTGPNSKVYYKKTQIDSLIEANSEAN